MTIWALLEECVQQLDEPFRRSEIVGWFRRHHPEVLEQSLSAHIQGATVGAPGRGPFTSRAPLLERVDRGVYRRARAERELVPDVAPAMVRALRGGAVATPGPLAAVLVGCVKGKRSTAAPAADLYTSPLFIRRRAYAEASGLPWFVLSAEHGLVRPDTLIEPYDRALADQPPTYQETWGAWVAVRLEEAIEGLAGRTVEVHAGKSYVDALRGPLERRGCVMVLPLRRLRQGEQLAWYDANCTERGAVMSEHESVVQRAESSDVGVDVSDVRQLEPFSFKWPEEDESFETGWSYQILVDGESHQVRHGLGGREVYGRFRVHTVTWLDNQVLVEGVEADDYPSTRALISGLRRPDKGLVQTIDEVPAGYDGFDLVEHRREIEAKWSRHSLAVKIREDDLAAWGLHAWLRMKSRTSRPPEPAAIPPAKAPSPLPPPPASFERRAVATALLVHGRALATALGGDTVRLTPNDEANALIHDDPFAFLIAVVCDQGIVAERAWAIPYDLKQRLGHLEPGRMAGSSDAVRAAFGITPKLHRFVNNVADWVWQASAIVVNRYGQDASRIWSDEPSAAELRARFDAFPGIGQKKAAMAVEILERDLHVKLTNLSGSDIAYDIHVRRVFLRTGLAERDDVGHMVAVARSIHPERPGELDNPAWDVGRRWCRPSDPDCPSCPLLVACPRLIERGNAVRGV